MPSARRAWELHLADLADLEAAAVAAAVAVAIKGEIAIVAAAGPARKSRSCNRPSMTKPRPRRAKRRSPNYATPGKRRKPRWKRRRKNCARLFLHARKRVRCWPACSGRFRLGVVTIQV